ncbi:hypothetical protein ASC95_05240 [Pelomonas sp. Root1217]|uniref:hypothetical protein n=1 Tax=Pelomonas sp. Root1217 TaxID=1736430 RepID=UPI0007090CDC|nr:hypothetical protein [Pelomonas sp. Root1217]KQV60832.1 hypothetical protein ASC95_05240 [Pelomonas sp. Root1217]
MSGFIALVPLLLVPLLYAVLVKLAARLLRRMQLSWKHALLFGLIALVVGAIGTVANQSTGRVLPALVAGLLGVAIQLVVGGWYLGPRARTASGELIGFGRGALLSLVAFGIVFAIGIAAAFLLPVGKQP